MDFANRDCFPPTKICCSSQQRFVTGMYTDMHSQSAVYKRNTHGRHPAPRSPYPVFFSQQMICTRPCSKEVLWRYGIASDIQLCILWINVFFMKCYLLMYYLWWATTLTYWNLKLVYVKWLSGASLCHVLPCRSFVANSTYDKHLILLTELPPKYFLT